MCCYGGLTGNALPGATGPRHHNNLGSSLPSSTGPGTPGLSWPGNQVPFSHTCYRAYGSGFLGLLSIVSLVQVGSEIME